MASTCIASILRLKPSSRIWTASTRRLPLAPVQASEDARPFEETGWIATGITYRVDLAPVTIQAGLFDLRIDVADPAGNTAQFTLEPAGVVAAPGKRRAVR